MSSNHWTQLLSVALLAALLSGPGCTRPSPARRAPPDNATIDRVCKITADLLGVSASDVTATTNLYELGADELDFVELVMEIEDQFDVTISDESIEDITGPQFLRTDLKKATMMKLAGMVGDQN